MTRRRFDSSNVPRDKKCKVWRAFFTCLCVFTVSVCLKAQSTEKSRPGADRTTVSQILGFELVDGGDLPVGWSGWPPKTISMDKAIVHSGKWSVRLSRGQSSPSEVSVLSVSIPIDFSGKELELSGYLRTDNVANFVGLWLREDTKDANMIALENMQEQAVRGTSDWKKFTVKLPLHADAAILDFGVLLSGTGTAWADDLELLVDGKSILDAPQTLKRVTTVLETHHEFDGGSKLIFDHFTKMQVDNLFVLGKVWGFLKYHHKTVTSGQRHWDYELLKVLPDVLSAKSRGDANAVLVRWIDTLGMVQSCNPCVRLDHSDLMMAPDLNWISDRERLGKQLSSRLTTIYQDRPLTQGFYVSLNPQIGNPVFEHELTYQGVNFPDSGFQLLALYRFWNIMQYWSPNREIPGESWTEILNDFIPRIGLAKDKASFELEMLALLARAHDTHTNLWSSLQIRPPAGGCQFPVNVRFIEGKAIVASYASSSMGSASGLRVGDVIQQLGGIPVEILTKTWSPFYADSNEAARLRDIARSLTKGICGPTAVQVERRGERINLTAIRLPLGQMDEISFTHDRPGATFQLLMGNIAYLKLSTVKAKDVVHYIESASGTKGLIIDIRNYPSEFVVFTLGSLLVTERTPFALFTNAELSNPGAFQWGHNAAIDPALPHYSGKVVILVDEDSQSQAEYTAMALRASPHSMIVGSMTAGADGNVSLIPLPGDLSTMISGLGVFYPDKRPTQRVGIRPDILVEPTISGIEHGRDEVLEEAIRQIDGRQQSAPDNANE